MRLVKLFRWSSIRRQTPRLNRASNAGRVNQTSEVMTESANGSRNAHSPSILSRKTKKEMRIKPTVTNLGSPATSTAKSEKVRPTVRGVVLPESGLVVSSARAAESPSVRSGSLLAERRLMRLSGTLVGPAASAASSSSTVTLLIATAKPQQPQRCSRPSSK